MIVVDASALVAILLDEEEKAAFTDCMLSNEAVVSPVGYWEAAIRARRLHGQDGVDRLDRLMAKLEVSVAPATAEIAKTAVYAERTFGKHTPAKLNLGDCFAYALAKDLDAPLLYKGEDFTRTDVASAL